MENTTEAAAANAPKTRVRPLVVCGPSGVGKGTLLSRLLVDYPSYFGKSVSHTTRAPRDGEVNGVSYHFTDKAVMEKEIAEGKFIEYAHVHTNIYGTSIAAVQHVADSGRICILEIDVQGAEAVQRTTLNPYYLFILPPSFEILSERLKGRGSESDETLNIRLNTAKKELDFLNNHKNMFNATIINDNLEKTYRQLKKQLKEWYSQVNLQGLDA